MDKELEELSSRVKPHHLPAPPGAGDILRPGEPARRNRFFAGLKKRFEWAKAAGAAAILALGRYTGAHSLGNLQSQHDALQEVERLLQANPDSKELQDLYADMQVDVAGQRAGLYGQNFERAPHVVRALITEFEVAESWQDKGAVLDRLRSWVGGEEGQRLQGQKLAAVRRIEKGMAQEVARMIHEERDRQARPAQPSARPEAARAAGQPPAASAAGEGLPEEWRRVSSRIEVDHYQRVQMEVFNEQRGQFEMKTFEVPVYGTIDGEPLTLDDIAVVLRDYLDMVILGNRNIRDASLEHQRSYGLVWAARSLAETENTDEARRKAADIKMEYESVRTMLNWWHEAAKDREGGFSKPKETFSNGQSWGAKATGEYLGWLIQSDRGGEFLKGFATRLGRDPVNTEYTSASRFLGAMLRASCGVATKDGSAGVGYFNSQGESVQVIDVNGRVSRVTKAQNGAMYEIFKNMLDAYALGPYLETRYASMNLAYEFSHFDPQTKEPVFICHISPDRMWVYDVFQAPRNMAPFWYANLEKLPDRFKVQLGWYLLDNDPAKNTRLNMILLGTGNNFLSAAVSPAERTELCQKFGLTWNEGWSQDRKILVMERMGMVRRYGPDRVHGLKEHYRITSRLINLDTEEIDEATWMKLDWSPLRKMGNILGAWAQQQTYIQETRNHIIGILLGANTIKEDLAFLFSGNGLRHIPDIISPKAEEIKCYWQQALNERELGAWRAVRERGTRFELATMIRRIIPQEGFMRGFYRRVWFAACGIRNTDWASPEITQIRPYHKVRQVLQGVSEVKILRDGFLKKEKVSFEDLVAFAGLKVRRYHYDLIHMVTDAEGRWDTDQNLVILDLMRHFLNDYLAHYDEKQALIGAAGEAVKERWIMQHPNEARLILGIFEEWETEIGADNPRENLAMMSHFLNEFFHQDFFHPAAQDRQRRLAWINQWIQGHPGWVERIMQVWAELEEAPEDEWEAWLGAHPDMKEKIIHMTVDYPGRHAFGWEYTGAQDLEMTIFSICEDYVAQFYEEREWPWRRSGCRFNLWEREKRVLRVARRQKASMDLRPPTLRKEIRLADGRRLPCLDDAIVGRYLYDQLEWNPVDIGLNMHDRPGDPLGGIDGVKCLMMGLGEYFPGDGREVSPLWFGYRARRWVYRYAARSSWGYLIEQSKLVVKAFGGFKNWQQYWRDHRVYRSVIGPSKMHKILIALQSAGTLDATDPIPYLRALGCTEKEVVNFWAARRDLRIPKDDDTVPQAAAPATKEAMEVAIKALGGFPGASLLQILSGGRTRAEISKMVRNGAILGTASSFGANAVLFAGSVALGVGPLALGPAMLVTGPVGFVIGALAGLDRGDKVGGFSYFLGRFGLMGERIDRSDPITMALGYAPYRIFGWRFPRVIEQALEFLRPPACWDDDVNAGAVVEMLTKMKAQLGGEGQKG